MNDRIGMALELVGLAAVVGGVALIWWPAAPIVGGLGLLLLAQGVGRRG